MKKLLLFGGLTLLVLAVAGFITAQFFLGNIIKAGVNKFGPTMTQTKVELAGAKLSPFSGQGTLTGLVVGNPAGWSNNDAIRLGSVHINMEPGSVMKDHIVINEIVIDGPEFLYETKLVASNIGDILKNVEAAMGGNKAAEPQKDGKPIKMVIKKFTLRNGKVTLGVGAAALPLPMPPVEITDIGTKEGGITPAGVMFAVLRSVTTSVVAATTQALGKLGGTTGAATAEGVKQVGEAIKGLFGGAKNTEPAPAKK